jgi:hypothetical protein
MIDTIPISFIVDPVTIVNVSIDVNELSFAMGSVVLPISIVECTIRPFLLTIAVSEATDPFSVVGGTSLEGVGASLFSFCVWIVRSVFGNSFTRFIDCEISRISL